MTTYSLFDQGIQQGLIARALSGRAERLRGHQITFGVDPTTKQRYFEVPGVLKAPIPIRTRTESPDAFTARLESEVQALWDASPAILALAAAKAAPKPRPSPELTTAEYKALLQRIDDARKPAHTERLPEALDGGRTPLGATSPAKPAAGRKSRSGARINTNS